MSVYETLKEGKSVLWSALDEQGRYDVWSFHIEAGGPPFSFSAFCDLMDTKTSSEQQVKM